MTNELVRVISDFWDLVLDWTFRIIPTEEEFIDKLKEMTNRLVEELPKQKIPEIKKK